jgi:putative ABC transport system substrate-binding protein
MERREALAGLAAAAASMPVALRAQSSDRVRRIAWLDIYPADDPSSRARRMAVEEDLARPGWAIGRNLQIDFRWRILDPDGARRAGSELLELKPDAILCAGSPAVKVLKQLTATVPIIFILVAEPVEQGIVGGLARPGGNITGFAYLERTVGAKWLELLHEAAPHLKRVAYVFSPKASPYAPLYYGSIEAAGRRLGLQTALQPVNDPGDIEPALVQLGGDGGAIFNADAFINNNHRLAVELAVRHRVPAIYGAPGAAALGGLIGYSLDLLAQYRETVSYLDRILRGANPGDLPVQQPSKFRFGINLKTAEAQGITIPAALLARADELIE